MNTTIVVKIIWLTNIILIIFLSKKFFFNQNVNIKLIHDSNHNINSEKIVCENNFVKNKLENIVSNYNKKNISANECHMQFHMFSREFVKSCWVDFSQQNINFSCRNAMIHWIMEWFILNNLKNKNYIFEAKKFCDNTYNSGIKYFECIHWIWNWLIVKNNFNIKKSFEECKGLWELKSSCISGIYGWYFRYKADFQDPSFCKNQVDKNMCLMYIWAFFDEKKYTEKTWCEKSYDKNACLYWLGIMYSRQVDSEAQKIIKICQTRQCLQWAIFEANRIWKIEQLDILIKYIQKI